MDINIQTFFSKNVKIFKIAGIIIGVIVLVTVVAMWANSSAADVAKKEMEYLRIGDMQAAYGLTSQNFQTATSLEQFKDFVAQYPLLTQNTGVTLDNKEVANDAATVSGTLTAPAGEVTPLELKFVKEKNQWRIFSINLKTTEVNSTPAQTTTPTQPAATASKTNLAYIYVNDEADKNGTASANKTVFSLPTPKIFTSAYIEKAAVGLQIIAVLIYLPTGDQVGPITNNTTQAGNIISNFSFTAPTAGWPVGDYKISISLSDGQAKDVTFSVK